MPSYGVPLPLSPASPSTLNKRTHAMNTPTLIGTYATRREALQHAKWLRAKGRNAYARKANKSGEYAVWEKV